MQKSAKLLIYGTFFLSAVGVVSDLLQAESRLRGFYQFWFPSWPDQVSLSHVRIESAGGMRCIFDQTLSHIDKIGEPIPVVLEQCHKEVVTVTEQLSASIPRDNLIHAEYLIIDNKHKSDIKELQLLRGQHDPIRLASIGSNQSRAICINYKDKSQQEMRNFEVKEISVRLTHNGASVSLDPSELPRNSEQIAVPGNCTNVFYYPH